MVLLGIGFVSGVPVLWSLGIVAFIIGAVLAIASGVGHTVGPRPSYY
ncbi:MAG TPA: hypothetical protein VE442_11425 [Jatrophihabitans sp.]|nr:hypothetical protein [Jatrophihabitans sp.]